MTTAHWAEWKTGGRAALPVIQRTHAEYLSSKAGWPCAILSRGHGKQHCGLSEWQVYAEEAARFFNSPIPEMPQRIELDFAALQARYWQRKACEVPLIPCLSFTSLKMGMAASFYERVKQFTPLVEITYPQHQPPFPSLAARWPLLHFCWSGCARKVLLVAQSFDGIKVGGFSGRVEAKADSHQGCREQELARSSTQGNASREKADVPDSVT